MSRVIAIVNHKGGVAKTTTVSGLGAALAEKGYKVLAIDLDAQSNLTTSLHRGEPEETIYEAIRDRKEAPIVEVSENFHLIPSSLDLAGIDLEVASEMGREYILSDIIAEAVKGYDYTLIDCAPSLGLLTAMALTASTDAIIPLTAEALPTKGLQKIVEIIDTVRKRLNRNLCLSGILITKYNSRKLTKMVEEQLRAHYGELVFNTKIRENIALAEAPLYAQSILDYAPDSNGAKDYRSLADEVAARIK